MRVFICSFGDFSVAIPMRSVASVSLYCLTSGNTAGKPQTGETVNYFSLPLLFSLPQEKISHCINLKKTGAAQKKNAVILTTEVEFETEIRETGIYPLPKTLGVMRLSAVFNGFLFYSGLREKRAISGDSDDGLVLLLNPGYFA